MSKGSWRELLSCKDCHKIVKNQHRLVLEDRVHIKVYTDNDHPAIIEDLEPYYTFKLTIESIKRPGAQRNHRVHPLLSDLSLQRCQQILSDNSKAHHRSIWLASSHHIMCNIDDYLFLNSDNDDDVAGQSQWVKEKKKEFKAFYAQIEARPVCHGKDCHVDFYLSPLDERGLIGKIKRREKLKFSVDENGERKYLGDTNNSPLDKKSLRNILIKYFIVEIYTKNHLILKLKGNVYLERVDQNISLEHLAEQGIEMPSQVEWGVYG